VNRLLSVAALTLVVGMAAFSPAAHGAQLGDASLSAVASVATAPVPFPSSIAADCAQADDTTALENWLNALPAGSSVLFPHNGCFHIQGTLWIHNHSGLSINGNGSTFSQTVSAPASTNQPIVYLTEDSDLSLTNLTVDGDYNGTNGGEYYEGDYGFLLEADQGITLKDVTANNIQGDFINLQAPDSGDTPGDQSLNSDIVVTDSTFHNSGYHGITIESADGATFSNDTFSDIALDAMDFEYDDYSTGFSGTTPQYAAEDNIDITDDTWTSVGAYWFASIQGQVPGVQEQNVTLSGNTISDSSSALFYVVGTNQSATTPAYELSGLTILNNHWVGSPATQSSAGSITTPYASSAAHISNANDVTIAGNTFPVNDGTPTYFPNTAFLALLQADAVVGLKIEGNDFAGALGILHPSSAGNEEVTECGNHFGVNGSRLDAGCPSLRLPSPASPGVELPETTYVIALPLLLLVALGGLFMVRRRRGRSVSS
jgi:MYXO-CTERM domain-containing protein